MQTNPQYHLLLADDDDDDALLFQEAIQEINIAIKFSHVRDGRKVVNFLKEAKPDLLFLDINMPNINGLECLKLIRSDDSYDFLPIIIYSTSNNTKYIESCYREGANRYIVKPYTYTGIINLLKELLSSDIKSISGKPDKDEFVLEITNSKS